MSFADDHALSAQSTMPRTGVVSLCLFLAQFPCGASVFVVGMFILHASPKALAVAESSVGGLLFLAGLAFGVQSIRTAGIAFHNICGVTGVIVPLLLVGVPIAAYLLH